MTDNSMISVDDRSSTEGAKERAANVAATAKDDASQVTNVTKEGVKDVAHETVDQALAVGSMAKDHARGLVDQTTTQLRSHGDEQAQRAAGGLDQIARQVGSLLDGRPADAGQVRDYAEQLGDKAQKLAEQLRSGGIDGVVEEVTSFARRRPGLFLVGAAAAGFMAGRLVKAQRASSDDGDSTEAAAGYRAPLPPQVPTTQLAGYPATAGIPSSPEDTVAGYPVTADIPPAGGPLGAAPGGGTW